VRWLDLARWSARGAVPLEVWPAKAKELHSNIIAMAVVSLFIMLASTVISAVVVPSIFPMFGP
jgi:hypothetical protein